MITVYNIIWSQMKNYNFYKYSNTQNWFDIDDMGNNHWHVEIRQKDLYMIKEKN